jgi:hypothetical protein
MYKAQDTSHGFVCTECEAGFSCSSGAYSVVMTLTLGLPLSVEEFSLAVQLQYRQAVAAIADTDVKFVVIVSISAQATSRRLLSLLSLRRLLSYSIAVEFAIILDVTTNISSVEHPTSELVNEEMTSRNLSPVQMLVAPLVVIYDQRELCPPTSFCAGGEQIFFCRPFSLALPGATGQQQCMCEAGYYSLNTTGSCNKCPPGSFCPGGLALVQCPANATSAGGAHSEHWCFCNLGFWRGCSRTNTGAFINNTGQPCVIDWTAPCRQCRANDICFNDTLLHCPEHSVSGPGSSEPSHCQCVGGFAAEY